MALGFQSSLFSQPSQNKKAAHTHRDCVAFYFFTFLPFYFFTFLPFYFYTIGRAMPIIFWYTSRA